MKKKRVTRKESGERGEQVHMWKLDFTLPYPPPPTGDWEWITKTSRNKSASKDFNKYTLGKILKRLIKTLKLFICHWIIWFQEHWLVCLVWATPVLPWYRLQLPPSCKRQECFFLKEIYYFSTWIYFLLVVFFFTIATD